MSALKIGDIFSIGDILDCGCEVVPVTIPCGWQYEGTDDEGMGHDYADTGCGDCQFGVPGVYHECGEG